MRPIAKTTRTTRRERAIAVREVVLPWLREHGRQEAASGVRFTRGSIGDFEFFYRTLFSGWEKVTGAPVAGSYQKAALLQQLGPQLPYALDVVRIGAGKVMSLAWGTGEDQIELISFRAAGWEQTLLALLR